MKSTKKPAKKSSPTTPGSKSKRRTRKQKLTLIRKVLRHADRQGQHIKAGYSRLEDDRYIYHAHVHINAHAGGYVYFATIERKKPIKKCECCHREFPLETVCVFQGRWDSYTGTVNLTATDDGWGKRIAYVKIERDRRR